jgi:citrate lyase beta subunit
MKSLVDPSHARAVNAVFTPSRRELAHARKVVSAFEVPIYAAAKRLLATAARS